MPYNPIVARRLGYDIDGTEIGTATREFTTDIALIFNNGPTGWLNPTEKGNLNKENRIQNFGCSYGGVRAFWFFFPENREETHFGIQFPYGGGGAFRNFTIQGSNNTTNGVDGTWENGVFTAPANLGGIDAWRTQIIALSFSSAMKVLRVAFSGNGSSGDANICGFHIYGFKADGQTPDDVIFCGADGVEYQALKDWGDTPEGSTYNDVFYLKNVSSKQANNLNVQLNDGDYLISFDQSTWTAVLNIASISAGQISQPIYVRKTLGPPLLTLGPKSARVILTIGSFT